MHERNTIAGRERTWEYKVEGSGGCNTQIEWRGGGGGESLFVGWLLNVPATCQCISGTGKGGWWGVTESHRQTERHPQTNTEREKRRENVRDPDRQWIRNREGSTNRWTDGQKEREKGREVET